MQHSHFDAIVIGSGPGGEGAAMGLVKQGKRVAVIERYDQVGGGCTLTGELSHQKLYATRSVVLSSLIKTRSIATNLA